MRTVVVLLMLGVGASSCSGRQRPAPETPEQPPPPGLPTTADAGVTDASARLDGEACDACRQECSLDVGRAEFVRCVERHVNEPSQYRPSDGGPPPPQSDVPRLRAPFAP